MSFNYFGQQKQSSPQPVAYVTNIDWDNLRKFLEERDQYYQNIIQSIQRENQEIRKLVEDIKAQIKKIYLDNSLFD